MNSLWTAAVLLMMGMGLVSCEDELIIDPDPLMPEQASHVLFFRPECQQVLEANQSCLTKLNEPCGVVTGACTASTTRDETVIRWSSGHVLKMNREIWTMEKAGSFCFSMPWHGESIKNPQDDYFFTGIKYSPIHYETKGDQQHYSLAVMCPGGKRESFMVGRMNESCVGLLKATGPNRWPGNCTPENAGQ
ncbi:MAG: hypothetical protein GMKNLPBB_02555 [Myxococcota bacterium]|nr:hypothetical protein [Myxococcota bacterium]